MDQSSLKSKKRKIENEKFEKIKIKITIYFLSKKIYNKYIINLEVLKMEKIIRELEEKGYDYAVAIATQAEIEAGAACGQLSIIVENDEIK